jgi:hypothetical protein
MSDEAKAGPAWKRVYTLETLPEEYRGRLERLAALAEPEHGSGPYLRPTDDPAREFLEFLNYGPRMTEARDEIAARYPKPDNGPDAKAARTQYILEERLRAAWAFLAGMWRATFARFRELEGDRELESGAELFQEVVARIRAHYYLEEEWHYTICGLFVMQAWAVRAGALPAVFYLYFGGSMSSGKSNILQLIALLTDGLMLENVSPSAVARVISSDGEGRALLLDEIDVERGQELDDVMAALLRSGYRRNGPPYVRWNAKEKKAESFSVFGPKAGSYRSSLDPALQSRGFVIPTAKPTGEDYYGLVLANLWPRTADLVPRLRDWGAAATRRWPGEVLEETAHSPEFQADLRRVTGMLGANRESELVTIALLVARMVPIDAASSLQNAAELRKVEISEDQAEAIEELREVTLANLAKTVSFAADGHEVYRVAQKSVRDEISRRRKERQERPITPGRLALLRREWGVKDAWLVEYGHRIVWNLPKAFVDSVQTPPPGSSYSPTILPSTSLTEGNSPGYSHDASTDVKTDPRWEHGSTIGVPGGGYTPGDALSDKSGKASDTGGVREEAENWTVPKSERSKEERK